MGTSSEFGRRLGLGTAQFGLAYGIANASGRTPEPEVRAIVARAREAGVQTLDTAPRYGDAERVLGRLGAELAEFRIVTKTAAHVAAEDVAGEGSARADIGPALERALDASLADLGLRSVHGLLEHRASALLGAGGDVVWSAMQRARESGRVARIGASVYSPEELDALLERFELDLVQLPLNVLDRRFVARGRMERLQDLGVEVHSRSVFLQGALLAPPSVSARVGGLAERVERFHARCAAQGWTPLAAALAGAIATPTIAAVLVGVEDVRQLNEILAAEVEQVDPGAFADLRCDDPAIVDPSRWS